MNSKGFTVVELVIVTAIITLLSALLIARIHITNPGRALKGGAQELAANIRKTQNMAVSTKKTGGDIPCGYGLYFDKNTPSGYILFAEWDSDPNCGNINRDYDGGSEKIKEIIFSSPLVEIASTNPSPLSLFFLPPDPETFVNGSLPVAEVTITLKSKGDPAMKIIKINSAGRVRIE